MTKPKIRSEEMDMKIRGIIENINVGNLQEGDIALVDIADKTMIDKAESEIKAEMLRVLEGLKKPIKKFNSSYWKACRNLLNKQIDQAIQAIEGDK